jgi:hypothetical protein
MADDGEERLKMDIHEEKHTGQPCTSRMEVNAAQVEGMVSHNSRYNCCTEVECL